MMEIVKKILIPAAVLASLVAVVLTDEQTSETTSHTVAAVVKYRSIQDAQVHAAVESTAQDSSQTVDHVVSSRHCSQLCSADSQCSAATFDSKTSKCKLIKEQMVWEEEKPGSWAIIREDSTGKLKLMLNLLILTIWADFDSVSLQHMATFGKAYFQLSFGLQLRF